MKNLTWDYLGWRKFYHSYHQADWNNTITSVISVAKIEYYDMMIARHLSFNHSHHIHENPILVPNQIRVSRNLYLLLSHLPSFDNRKTQYSGLHIVIDNGLSDDQIFIENTNVAGFKITIEIENFHKDKDCDYNGDPHPHGHGHHDHEYDHHEYEHHHRPEHHKHDHDHHNKHHDNNNHHKPEHDDHNKHQENKKPVRFDFIRKIFKK